MCSIRRGPTTITRAFYVTYDVTRQVIRREAMRSGSCSVADSTARYAPTYGGLNQLAVGRAAQGNRASSAIRIPATVRPSVCRDRRRAGGRPAVRSLCDRHRATASCTTPGSDRGRLERGRTLRRLGVATGRCRFPGSRPAAGADDAARCGRFEPIELLSGRSTGEIIGQTVYDARAQHRRLGAGLKVERP